MARHRTLQSNPQRALGAIVDFLAPDNVMIDVDAPDKVRLLWDLSHWAAPTVGLDGDAISDEILKREELGSTGMGGGVAIPHARFPHLKRSFGILARLKNRIDFEAIDGERVDIVFLLLLPETPDSERVIALASVARKLRDSETIVRIRHAKDRAHLYRAIVTEDENSKKT